MSLKVKFCSVFLAALLAITAILPQFSVATDTSPASEQKAYVTGENINVRSGPGTEFDKLGQISNDYVTILGYENSTNGYVWYKIKYGEMVGYIIGEYITFPEVKKNFLKGDVNGDGLINAADAAPLDKHILGEALLVGEYLTAADINSDGVVNAADRALLGEHLNGTTNLYINAFPESYRKDLLALLALYPNYIFIPDYIDIPFWEAVQNETLFHRKLVNMSSDSVSWRALGPENYDWATGKFKTYSGNWTDASREVIAYYMDPRNFLNIDSVYMFLQQSYNPSQTIDAVNLIIKDTFLATPYNDPNDTAFEGSYAKVIMEAAKQSNVSPLVLASTIILEQGVKGTSDLISGTTEGEYKGYYNFFNFSASGDDVIKNGLAYAKSQGWNSRSASIIGGAKKYAAGYIAVGQDTYYYKDFDVNDASPYTHQYAQSVYDARSSSARLRSYYRDKTDLSLLFKIPVYKDMRETPILRPPENERLNNYYFKNIQIGGLTPAFSTYTESYTLNVDENLIMTLSLHPGTEYTGALEFPLKKGENKIVLPVKSQTGYGRNYTIKITAAADCVLKVTTDVPQYVLGDINADKLINTADLAAVRLHLLGIRKLSQLEFLSADINKDGKINTADLAGVRLHLLGLRKINE